MTEEILNIVGKLLAALVVGILTYFAPKINTLLETWKIKGLVSSFVEAADQMFKAEDPDGSIRNNYVKEQLQALGVIITEQINAYIESEVYKLKHEPKKEVGSK